MTDSNRLVGPRGWAVLVLASGAALSAPFLRNPGNPPQTVGNSDQAAEVDFSKKSWPDVREKSLTPSGPIVSNLSQQDFAELEQLKSNSASAPRKLTGTLPSTTGTPLPSWADRGPRIDQLVNESIRTEPLAPTAPATNSELNSMRPWMGHGMKTNADSSLAAPMNTDIAADFDLSRPNPDARWSTSASSPNTNSLPQNFGSRDSGALAGNGPFRKFEDHVTQWPDEKLPPSQFAWDSQQPPQAAQDLTDSNPTWPPVSRPSGFQVAGQTHSPSTPGAVLTPVPIQSAPQSPPVVSNAQYASPETVSAPMVSSQSGRQAPRVNSPTIEAPKPSTNSSRPKHFIQQPTKRA